MVAEKRDEIEGKRCILVGLQVNSNGKELLSWALNNVTQGGDRVIAVNVFRTSDLGKTIQSSIKALDGFLSEYEDLCTVKRVSLVGRVSRGTSIKKTLVKEVVHCTPVILVVGANSSFSIGSSTSVAKYCAKQIPPSTTLFAFHNGKVVFERRSKLTTGEVPKPNIRSILHPSVGMDTKAIIPSYNICDRKPKIDATSTSVIEQKPGWPLLRRAAVQGTTEASKGKKAGQVSVVQWAMNLPDRSTLSLESAVSDLIKELEIILRDNLSTCKWFQYEELQTSTNNFSTDYLIGKGGNSRVYKGCLANGEKVAIKLSKLSKETSGDFLSEADIITKLQHKRIVPLLGISVEHKNFLSVYAYFSKGSLEENLHGNRAKPPLAWDKRFKIAVGIAEALSYLHNGSLRPVIHRDVKSSNILLNEEFEPQLSDFGLATRAPTDSLSQTHSDLVGTFGYLAPEYFLFGKVSEKIDVYAYGVVLLELLTGRKPISSDKPRREQSLVMWATPVLERADLTEFLDPKLDGKYDKNQLRKMVVVASLCISRAARLRPEMSQVVSLFKGDEEIELWIDSRADDLLTELDCQDEETYPSSSIRSHLSLALLDVEEDNGSIISFEQNHLSSLDDYLRDRWSISPGFD